MKLKLFACLVAAGALLIATQAMAAQVYTPFLSVDINGYNAGGGQTIGPTQAGYDGWEMAEGLFLDPSIDWGASGAAGLTKVFGSVTANLKGFAPSSFLGARNRGANTDINGADSQDFVFSQRNVNGFGQTYNKLTLSGLLPNQVYEFTGYARDHFNGGADSFAAWSDRGFIGADGPGPYMDANFGAGSLYQPAPGGVNNPIPTKGRAPISGPADTTDPTDYSEVFRAKSNGGGVLEIYTWGDPNTYSGTQTAALINGFQLAVAPEPTSLVLLLVGLAGVMFGRRR